MLQMEIEEAARQLETLVDAFADGSLDQVVLCRAGVPVALMTPLDAQPAAETPVD